MADGHPYTLGHRVVLYMFVSPALPQDVMDVFPRLVEPLDLVTVLLHPVLALSLGPFVTLGEHESKDLPLGGLYGSLSSLAFGGPSREAFELTGSLGCRTGYGGAGELCPFYELRSGELRSFRGCNDGHCLRMLFYLGVIYSADKMPKTYGTKREVWDGTAKKTRGGLTKASLILNKDGKPVSRKKSAQAKAQRNLGGFLAAAK